MKPKIIVSIINNIAYDQRIEKVCNTLHTNGYTIELIGTTLKGKPKINRPYTTSRLSMWFHRSVLMFAEFNIRLFFTLLFKAKKDTILLSNDADSLLPNYLIATIKGCKLVFDSHEIYSEMPSVQGKLSQKVWCWIERKIIPKVDAFYTVSPGYANWFLKNYDTLPHVIYNYPLQNNILQTSSSSDYILYQGALNMGRGLLSLIEAIQYTEGYTLKIAGDGPFKPELEKAIHNLDLSSKVELLGSITPDELISITQNAAVGVSLEEDLGLSYRYALPNKLFDYIQAEIPIITTYLPEIKHITEHYKIGEIIESHHPKSIAESLQKVLSKSKSAYKENLQRAKKELVWEKQENKLLSIFKNI